MDTNTYSKATDIYEKNKKLRKIIEYIDKYKYIGGLYLSIIPATEVYIEEDILTDVRDFLQEKIKENMKEIKGL